MNANITAPANVNFNPPADLGRFQSTAIGVGIIGVIAWIIGAFVSGHFADTFFRTYLVAYVFWVGIALGCLGLLMIQYLGGATWGLVIRRQLEAAAHTLFLMGALFIPIIFGLRHLYEWSHGDIVAANPILQYKSGYLNLTGFTIRTIIYFAIWLTIIWLLRTWGKRQDETSEPNAAFRWTQRAQKLSGPGFLIYGLAVTFASIDWIMSLDAEWFSTIFGLLTLIGQGVAAIAFLITICVLLARYEPMASVLQPKHFHDLGKLQLATVMVWAYFSFSQLLIIWSGNLPEETPFYLERFRGQWRYIGLAIILLHFILPFLLLLSRDLKHDARRLRLVAWLLLIMRFADLLWLIVPGFVESGHQVGVNPTSEGHPREEVIVPHVNPALYLVYIAAWIGIGGIWLGWFFWQLRSRPLLPQNDPQLEQAFARGEHLVSVGSH